MRDSSSRSAHSAASVPRRSSNSLSLRQASGDCERVSRARLSRVYLRERLSTLTEIEWDARARRAMVNEELIERGAHGSRAMKGLRGQRNPASVRKCGCLSLPWRSTA